MLEELQRKSHMVHEALNRMVGVSCLPIEGAIYAFPQVFMPKKFIAEARGLGREPDVLYCIKLLEKTWVIVVPGSGFGQRKDTWHYRITILPEETVLNRVPEHMERFQAEFM